MQGATSFQPLQPIERCLSALFVDTDDPDHSFTVEQLIKAIPYMELSEIEVVVRFTHSQSPLGCYRLQILLRYASFSFTLNNHTIPTGGWELSSVAELAQAAEQIVDQIGLGGKMLRVSAEVLIPSPTEE